MISLKSKNMTNMTLTFDRFVFFYCDFYCVIKGSKIKIIFKCENYDSHFINKVKYYLNIWQQKAMFASASHQTGFDARSVIKVGIRGGVGREMNRSSNPAGLSAMWV